MVQPVAVHVVFFQPVAHRRQEIGAGVGVLVVEARHPLRRVEHGVVVGPVVPGEPVVIGAVAVRLRVHEDRVPVGDVVRHQVEQHADAPRVRLPHQRPQVVVRPQQRVYRVEVAGIVAVIGGAGEDRGEPERVGPQVADIVELLGDAAQGAAELIAPALARAPGCAAAGVEAVGEDVVEDGFAHPIGGGGRIHQVGKDRLQPPGRLWGRRRRRPGPGRCPAGPGASISVAHEGAGRLGRDLGLPDAQVVPEQVAPGRLAPRHRQGGAVGGLAPAPGGAAAVGGIGEPGSQAGYSGPLVAVTTTAAPEWGRSGVIWSLCWTPLRARARSRVPSALAAICPKTKSGVTSGCWPGRELAEPVGPSGRPAPLGSDFGAGWCVLRHPNPSLRRASGRPAIAFAAPGTRSSPG